MYRKSAMGMPISETALGYSVLVTQSTSDPPDGIGFSFAASLLQLMLLNDNNSCFLLSGRHNSDERHNSLRSALVSLCVPLRPLDGPIAIIRTDSAPRVFKR